MAQQYPPFTEKVLDQKGVPTRPWYQWLMDLTKFVNNIETGGVDVSMKANKVLGATIGHVVELKSGGDIDDSGLYPPNTAFVGVADTQTLTNKTLGTIHQNNLVGLSNTQTLTNKTLGIRHQDNLADRTMNEDITGVWRFARKRSVTFYTDATLTENDFGKVVKFETGTDHVTCHLPSVAANHLDGEMTIMRLGTGRLTIRAADLDVIESSSAGGSIYCDEVGRIVANVTLYLAAETKWAIVAATGVWKVT